MPEISELPAAAEADLSDDDVFVVNDGTTTKRVTFADLKAAILAAHLADATDPHNVAGYATAMGYNGDTAAWEPIPGNKIYIRTAGDPDPALVKADGDVTIDASGA